MSMTITDIRKAITTYGKFVREENRKKICRVTCQGCGKDIFNDLTEPVEFVVTKRGTALFWHPECTKKAWKNKILWRKD